MKSLKLLLIGVVAFIGISCSTAGPFVTGISSDGKGGLIVQKGYVEHNSWTGQIVNKEAGESTIKIFPEKEAK